MPRAGRQIILRNFIIARLRLYGWERLNNEMEKDKRVGTIAGRACRSATAESGAELDRDRQKSVTETGYDLGPNDTMATSGSAVRQPPDTPYRRGRRISLTCASLVYINKRVTMIIMEEQELKFERCSR
jgi:hypothetical protein